MRGDNGFSDRDRDHRISYLRVIHLVWVASDNTHTKTLVELNGSPVELKGSLADVRSQRDQESGRVDKLLGALTNVLANLSRGND